MKNSVKIIFHVDMNAFFASCAIIKEPFLKDKVFAIGGHERSSNKGVLSTSSYLARKYKITAGMSIADAMKRYQGLLIVPSDMQFYAKKSREFMAILKTFSSNIYQASIDEAYLDMTQLSKKIHPLKIAKEIKNRLLNECQLPCSIGIAPTIYLAKMGSDLKKPLGISVVRKRELATTIWPLSIGQAFGIGKVTNEILKSKQIFTINDFLNSDNQEKVLSVMSLKHYYDYVACFKGESSDILETDKYNIPKSISRETTFVKTTVEYDKVLNEILNLSNYVYKVIERKKLFFKTINLKLKTIDFKVYTRSISLKKYSNKKTDIFDNISIMFEENYDLGDFRLVGAGVSNIITTTEMFKQVDLFNYHLFISQKEENLIKAIDSFNRKNKSDVKKLIWR